jgi:glycosyltransferase involved in cell wall biosynthesis
MKKIVIDVTTLSDQFKHRGIGTYTREITRHILKDDSIEWHVIGFDDMRDSTLLQNAEFHSLGPAKPSSFANIFLFNRKYKPILDSIKPDGYFCPQFERGFPTDISTLLAIHDLIPIKTNSYSQKSFLHNILKRMYYKYQFNKARHAKWVITLTNFSKRELVSFGFDEGKIEYAHLAVNTAFYRKNILDDVRRDMKKKYRLGDDFILYYGGVEKHKNIVTALRAFALLQNDFPSLGFVIVTNAIGSYFETYNSTGSAIVGLIDKLNIAHRVTILPTQSIRELAGVLSLATIFTHISTYEGFGLSVAEAMAAEVPTVIADASCYPEVFGGASLLVNPLDVDAVANGYNKVLTDEVLRNSLVEKGKNRAKELTWETPVHKVLKILQTL